jgi:hypothetical protein
MNLRFVHFGIAQRFLNWIHGGAEEVGTKFFEAGTRDVGVEIDAIKEGVDFDAKISVIYVQNYSLSKPCLSRTGQCAFGTLACSAKTAKCTWICADVLLVLSLKFRHEMVDLNVKSSSQ